MRLPRNTRQIIWWVLRVTNLSLMLVIALGTGMILGTYTGIAKLIPNARSLGEIRPGSGSRVLSAEGELLAVVATENRQFVSLEHIPKALQDAAIATEDRAFYQHIGINPKAIVRAAVHDVVAWGPRQGGSTITQQLARNVFLSQRKTVTRKLAEVILALQLERAYAKPEILELYLNQIYLGEGAYGVQIAAKTYFGKEAKDLDLAECALVAGLAKRPEYYSPFADEQRAIDRRNLVLAQMHGDGYVTSEQLARARQAPLKLVEEHKPLGLSSYKAPYFTSYVLRQVAADYGADVLYRGNMTIHTTLNLSMQEAAEEAVLWGMDDAERRRFKVNQFALAAVDVRTGAIKALVGGVDWNTSQYNLAVQGGRQPGSSFKPFVYTAALEAGYGPETIVNDSPVSYPGAPGKRWAPRNYDGKYHGPVSFRKALRHSYNVSAVKVADSVGIWAVIDVAKRLGIQHEMEPVLPLAIGSGDVSPLEMASAFAVFASGGMRTEPYGIQKIVDSRERTVEKHTVRAWRVLHQSVAEDMVSMLGDVIKYGTAAGIRGQIDFPAGGKTGTSNDYKDAWFIGFGDNLSTAVWGGNEPPSSTGKMAGGTTPARVWARFMRKAEPLMAAARAEQKERVVEISPEGEQPPEPPDSPPHSEGRAETNSPALGQGTSGTGNVVTKIVCPRSGMLAGGNCPDPREISYDLDAGSRPPNRTCDVHTEPVTAEQSPTPAPIRPRRRTPGAERVTYSVCAITGKLATSNCPIVRERTFDADAAPAETCDRHGRRTPRL